MPATLVKISPSQVLSCLEIFRTTFFIEHPDDCLRNVEYDVDLVGVLVNLVDVFLQILRIPWKQSPEGAL